MSCVEILYSLLCRKRHFVARALPVWKVKIIKTEATLLLETSVLV